MVAPHIIGGQGHTVNNQALLAEGATGQQAPHDLPGRDQAGLAVEEPLFDVLALRDVEVRSDHSIGSPFAVAVLRSPGENTPVRAVLVPQSMLQLIVG